MSLLRFWLALMAQTELGPAAVLRGSQLTARWVPGRKAADLDFLLMGEWSLERATRAVGALVGQEALPLSGKLGEDGDVTLEAFGIWLESPWPGLRLRLARAGEELQIDFGWAESLGVPPAPFELEGFTLPAVGPEVMFAWKVHSLVELGSRRMALSALDEFFDAPDWGHGRSSRHKWKKYAPTAPWLRFSREAAIDEARRVVARILGRTLATG